MCSSSASHPSPMVPMPHIPTHLPWFLGLIFPPVSQGSQVSYSHPSPVVPRPYIPSRLPWFLGLIFPPVSHGSQASYSHPSPIWFLGLIFPPVSHGSQASYSLPSPIVLRPHITTHLPWFLGLIFITSSSPQERIEISSPKQLTYIDCISLSSFST